MITVDFDCTDVRASMDSSSDDYLECEVEGSILIRLHYNGIMLPAVIPVSAEQGDTPMNMDSRVFDKLESLLRALTHNQAVIYTGPEYNLSDELFNRMNHLVVIGEAHSITLTLGE